MSAELTPIRQSDALDALSVLAKDLAEELSPLGDVTRVDPVSMPRSYQRLLVHTQHMTPTLKDYHGEPVDLHVLACLDDDRWYRRKIILTTAGRQNVVEFGLVRLDLTLLPDRARRAVLERDRPLGDILIEYGVMTEVEPLWFLRFGRGHPVAAHLAGKANGTCFGRLATIHCNGEAALDLLEVVTDVVSE